MSVVDDARDIYKAYSESPSGSYLESALADAIARDILPSLIHYLDNPPKPFGFAEEIREVISNNELAEDAQNES